MHTTYLKDCIKCHVGTKEQKCQSVSSFVSVFTSNVFFFISIHLKPILTTFFIPKRKWSKEHKTNKAASAPCIRSLTPVTCFWIHLDYSWNKATQSHLYEIVWSALRCRRPTKTMSRGADSLRGQQHVFPGVQLAGVRMLPVQVLAHSFGGKLRLTDVTEVPGQVDRLTWGGRR